MKKLMAIALIIIVVSIVIINNNTGTPYLGNYIYTLSNSTSIQLENNNRFSINYTSNRDSEGLTGKYSIDNNRIKLSYDNGDSILYSKIQEGKVEGSKISFNNMGGYF